jgi:hypothetical protein
MVHLGAEQAAGGRVVRVAGNSDGAIILNLNQQAAGVGAIVGADRAEDMCFHDVVLSGQAWGNYTLIQKTFADENE